MAQLPRYRQQMGAPRGGRIIDLPRGQADTAIGDTLQEVGSAGLEFADRIQKAKVEAEMVGADGEMRTALDRIKFDLEQDRSIAVDALPGAFRERAVKVVEEAGGKISSDLYRQRWRAQADGLLGEGDLWSRQLGRRRQVDEAKAGHVSRTETLEADVGDLAISEATYGERIKGAKALIDRDIQRGLISAEEGAIRSAALDALTEKNATVRTRANIEALYQAGKLAEAQAMLTENASRIDPETRDAMQRTLNEAMFETEVVDRADDIWSAANGDIGRALTAVGKVEDARLREKLEARVVRQAQLTEAARNARQEQARNAIWQHVANGGTIAKAPLSWVAAADPAALGSIRAYEEARDRSGAMSEEMRALWRDQSQNTKAVLMNLPPRLFVGGPAKWATLDPEVARMYASMHPDDMRAVNEAVLKAQAGGQTVDASQKVYKDLEAIARLRVPKWDMGTDSKQGTGQGRKLAAALRAAASQKAEQTGGAPLTLAEAEAIVNTAIAGIKPSAAKYDAPEDPFLEAVRSRVGGVLDVDPSDVEDARTLMQTRLGRPPTEDEIAAALLRVASVRGQSPPDRIGMGDR